MSNCKNTMAIGEQLSEQLNKLRGSRTVIVGIGNTLKGDDGAGPTVCQKLQEAKICAELIDAGTVPENYTRPIVKKAPQNLLIIDAIDFGASPGTARMFEPEQLNSFAFSTHTLSPHLFIDLIRREICVDVYVIGIQPAQTQFGQALSAKVSKSIQFLIDLLCKIFPPAK